MTIRDLLEETTIALSSNKVRSGLTMLGIVIGIASVIAMVAIGNGAQQSIQTSISSLGSNLLTIRPGATSSSGVRSAVGSAKSLTLDDANAISADISNVSAVAAEVSGNYQITAKGTNANSTVDGTTSSYSSIHNLTVADGSFISDQQVTSQAKVAVLGPTVRDTLFGTGAEAVGQTIRINDIIFTVIGVSASAGGTGFGSTDEEIFIPLSTAQQYLSGNKYVSSIGVQAANADSMTQVEADITTLLLTRHNIKDSANADFSVINQSSLLSTASSITSTFTTLLAAIAGISLVVGGIGIMNMMLTSVTERTREIGLRKAIGAAEQDISNQFLMESLALTVIGGLAGIALGWTIAAIATATGLLTAVVSWDSVLLAFGVSAAIGVVFGWYPARRAAKMNPIDALRFE
ncbi:MAG: ABC transporter permease [Candidatus Pacebacteria bacterium]|nr:ABC transporter permease [Candidatus Paceibacterota bacterium]